MINQKRGEIAPSKLTQIIVTIGVIAFMVIIYMTVLKRLAPVT